MSDVTKNILTENILDAAREIENELIRWRRELHRIPELGLELPMTVEYVTKELDKLGVEYTKLVNGNAIVGLIKGEKKSDSNSESVKTLGIRADMDGLPIKEETGFEFSSTNENMHACGHDGHTSMLLGTAKILQENRDKFCGNVKLLFQPGEEYPGGAEPMIKEGALENPKVDAVVGLHAGIINPVVPHGKIGVSLGQTMACMDRFKITVIGKGAHGAYPEQSVDPIAISTEIINALYKIKAREINATTPVVVSICQIHGGYNQNVIPDTVFFEGTARATDPETRKYVADRIEQIAKGVALSMNADVEIEYDFKYPPLVNDREFTLNFVNSAKKILNEEDVMILDKPIMGGEDFAFFSEKVPGTYFFLSNGEEVDGKKHPHHTPKFSIDESYLKVGTALFIQTALDFLK